MKRLYCNGKIITMRSPEVYDYIIAENGIIEHVGKGEAPCGDFEVKDLKGMTAMPAFIDAHSHFAAVADRTLQCRLDKAYSFEDIEKLIRSFMRDNGVKPGEWVKASGYDHNQLAEGVHPDIRLLDRICPNNPLAVSHASGHMGVFNSVALKLLGANASAAPPEGGKFGYTDGRLNGYMEESAFLEYLRKTPMVSREEYMRAFDRAQGKYASSGITTVQEGMLVNELCPVYKELAESERLRLDAVGYADYSSADSIYACLGGSFRHFRLGGVKIFLDGSPQGKTAYMLEPYEGEDEYRGYSVMSSEEVISALEYAARRGIQLLAHCNGDAAAEQFLSCAEKAAANFPAIRGLRFVMIHAQFVRPSQIDRAKLLGIIPSFFTAHSYYWGDTHIKNLGFERASGMSPAKSALERGIPFTFHQDSPVIEPDMLETIRCAAERVTKSGVRLEREKISVFEALRAVTANAAYQYGEEKRKGTLERGKNEDIVITDKNPLEQDISGLDEISIAATVKSGKTVYSAE
ncbi:amidohydrolase [Ruminococcus sp. Marseille-P6503]|uniref:amidohydrolase n=1 Tax=Ruminococcus sp. Marseille-P6503 TaxID=2364796 RepID=UPI000F53A431|nr:amidohydrolase [Ruminococcus sp. Marseille-P6503]